MERINSVKKGTYNLFCRQGHLFKERYYYNLCESIYARNMLPLSFRLTRLISGVIDFKVMKQRTHLEFTLFGRGHASKSSPHDRQLSFKLCDSRIMKDRSGDSCSFYGNNAYHIDGFRITSDTLRRTLGFSKRSQGRDYHDDGLYKLRHFRENAKRQFNRFRLTAASKSEMLFNEGSVLPFRYRHGLLNKRYNTFRLTCTHCRTEMIFDEESFLPFKYRSGILSDENNVFRLTSNSVRSEMTSGYGLGDRGWLSFSTSNIFRLANVDKRSALYLDDRPSLTLKHRYNYTTTNFATRGSEAYYINRRIFKIVKHD